MKGTKIKWLFLLTLPAFTSCFIQDEPVTPHQPGEESYIQLSENIYEAQIYFDLGSESVTGVLPNNHHHLAFDARPNGWIIRLNTADNHKICRVDNLSFEEVIAIPDSANWVYDSSDGNFDSTAIGMWVDTTALPYSYTNQVYLIGQFNGINYQVTRKIMFLSVDAEKYVFRMAKLNGDEDQEVTIYKSEEQDFICFNLVSAEVAEQLPRNSWDFVFAPYTTTLYTNEGVPTPYNVRGVFINESQVVAAMDTLYEFQEITYEYIDSLNFTNQRDIIGHDWKYYNGEDYVVRPHMNFVVRDSDGYYYKFRFTRFHDDQDVKGYPGFEFQRL